MVQLICAALLLIPSVVRQDAAPEMMTYQLVLLKRGPAAPPADPGDMRREHLAQLEDLSRKRIALIYGPVLADADIRGIAILAVPTADDARAHFANDPFVKARVMVPDVRQWMGPKGWFGAPVGYDVNDPANLDPLIFGFLVRGSNTSQDKPTAEALQKGHLAYMDGLHKAGKLVMAGPLLGSGAERGVVVYRVNDVAAARALAAEDPSVKAGRLALEAYPWMTFKGILK